MQLQLIPDERAGQWTNDDWATPWDLIRGLEAEFGTFDLDPCCTPETAKAPKFYTRETDGLAHDWHGRVFCNPPFTRKIEFLQKAYESSLEGALVICLVPANVGKRWFHEWVLGKAEVRYIRGVHFRAIGKDATTSPRDGCAIVIYRPR